MGFFDQFRMMPPVTKNLLIINILIWVAMWLIHPLGSLLQQYGALYYFTSESFLPTQLLTYMFIHANFMHLFFNMFALFMFGVTMERVLGGRRFLFYYITCGLGAALIQEGVFALMINHYASTFGEAGSSLATVLRHTNLSEYEVFSTLMNLNIDPNNPALYHLAALYHTPTIGASGAIFGILLAFGYMFPNVRLYLLFPPIPVRARIFVLGYAVIELLLGVYKSQVDTVAHFAHLGGMLFGLLILMYWRKKRIIGGPYF